MPQSSLAEATAIRPADAIRSITVAMNRMTQEDRKLFLLLLAGVLEQGKMRGES